MPPSCNGERGRSPPEPLLPDKMPASASGSRLSRVLHSFPSFRFGFIHHPTPVPIPKPKIQQLRQDASRSPACVSIPAEGLYDFCLKGAFFPQTLAFKNDRQSISISGLSGVRHPRLGSRETRHGRDAAPGEWIPPRNFPPSVIFLRDRAPYRKREDGPPGRGVR